MIRRPSAAKTASKDAVNLVSRSRIKNLTAVARSASSMQTFRACWVTQGVGPASADELPMPAQQGGRLNEEAAPLEPRDQSPQASQDSSIRRLQRRTMYLAPHHRHLVAQHDDLDRVVGVLAEGKSNEMDHAQERQVKERVSHCRIVATSGNEVKAQVMRRR